MDAQTQYVHTLAAFIICAIVVPMAVILLIKIAIWWRQDNNTPRIVPVPAPTPPVPYSRGVQINKGLAPGGTVPALAGPSDASRNKPALLSKRDINS